MALFVSYGARITHRGNFSQQRGAMSTSRLSKTVGVGVLVLVLAVTSSAHAGEIVLANDEWTLSDAGYVGSNDPGQFALNVAAWFTGGGPGTFHAYSTNLGLTGGSLAATMTGGGHTWTTGTGISFDLPTLLTGIFLASGPALDSQVLIDYVEAGGNVYLAGGTGFGGAATEAGLWNAFLNHFGLGFETSGYNGVSGSISISSPHPLRRP